MIMTVLVSMTASCAVAYLVVMSSLKRMEKYVSDAMDVYERLLTQREEALDARSEAMEWLESLEAKSYAFGEDEDARAAWLETEEGKAYADIMNESWREDWEEVAEDVWTRFFEGGESA